MSSRRNQKNFVKANIRAVSCSPSPAAAKSHFHPGTSTPRPRTPSPSPSPQSNHRQYLTPKYNTQRIPRSNSSPEIKRINERLEAVEKENQEMKQKMKENENETLKMKKKFRELKRQVKLLERLVSQPTVRTEKACPPETNQSQGTTSRAGSGTCGACGVSSVV